MTTTVHGASIVTPTGIIGGGWLSIVAGRISEIGGGEPPSTSLDLGGGWLVPGYLDIHCHGGAGADFGTSDADSLNSAVQLHAGHGTSAMLASLVAHPLDGLCDQLALLAELAEDPSSPVIGTHLEGPFLSRTRCGAQNPDFLIDPDVEAFGALLAAARGTLRMITIAPELPGALEVVDAAVAAGVVVAVGHTDATYSQSIAAFDRGATVATHLFNGMRPLHHREPGPVLASLDAGAASEVINDGVHVHPAVLRMVADRDAAQLILITDAISATGVGDGEYALGGQRVTVRDGQARLSELRSLAGSTLTMDRAVRRAVFDAGLPIEVAVAAASTNPARVLGLAAELGAIEVGLRADLLHLDHELRPQRRMRDGQWQ
jgi:N-acetylglucosamine-6-phosphate deacetylase